MAAFAAADAAGLGVELDVRISADGEPIVIHDATLQRTTEDEGEVAARTASALARVRLKGGGTVPHLADVLGSLPDTPLLVEMKVASGEEGPLEAKVADLLRRRAAPTAAMSFNPHSLAAFAAHAAHIARGQLTMGLEVRTGAAPVMLPPTHAAGADISNADFLSCNIAALEDYGAPAAARMGLPLIAWTIRTPTQLGLARKLAGNWIFEALPVESVTCGG